MREIIDNRSCSKSARIEIIHLLRRFIIVIKVEISKDGLLSLLTISSNSMAIIQIADNTFIKTRKAYCCIYSSYAVPHCTRG